MIRTVFSGNKGYHAPDLKKQMPDEMLEINLAVVSNGFDQLDWENNGDGIESGDETTTCLSDLSEEASTYEARMARGVKVRQLAYVVDSPFVQTLLTTHTTLSGEYLPDADNQADGEVAEKNKKQKKQNAKTKMTKTERKELKKKLKSEKKRARKGKKRHMHVLFDDESMRGYGRDKLRILNGLYGQVIKTLDGEMRALKFQGIIVDRFNLFTLLDDGWLDDNVIGFVYEYLAMSQVTTVLGNRIKFADPKQVTDSVVLLLPTFSFLLANDQNPKGLREVLPKMDHASFIFMPVNDNDDFEMAEGGTHWSLVLFCVPDHTAIVYDSMYRANEAESLQLIHNTEQLLDTKFNVVFDKNSPQQINGSDCGVLTCALTALLLDRVLNVPDNTYVNLNLNTVSLSAIDARIFIIGTIFNLMKARAEGSLSE